MQKVLLSSNSEFFNFSFKVRILVNKSHAHAQSLKLELLSLETRQSPPLNEKDAQDEVTHKMKRSELVKVPFDVIYQTRRKRV